MTDSEPGAPARARLMALLGDLPARMSAPRGELKATEHRGAVRIEHWRLHLHDDAGVPATLVVPSLQAPQGVALYCHAHGHRFDIGASELLQGRPALAQPPYGEALSQRRIAALAIDHRGFGERAATSERLLNKRLLWEGRTLWGMRVADTLAAFDWLRAQPFCAGLPIVTLGLSMGSTMAWWAAALEPGIAACVDLCGLAEFDALIATGSDDLHGEYWFVPGLRKHFTAAAINALIAPRPHLSCAGRYDPLTPAAGLAAIDATLKEAYAATGAPLACASACLPVDPSRRRRCGRRC